MLVDVLEVRITQADNLLLPFWDYSILALNDFLILFLIQACLFSLASLGVFGNSPFLLLPLIGVHVFSLVIGVNDIFSEVEDILSGVEGIFSITMVFSFLVVLLTTSTYIMMIFQDSNISSNTKKKVIPKKTEKKKETMVQEV